MHLGQHLTIIEIAEAGLEYDAIKFRNCQQSETSKKKTEL